MTSWFCLAFILIFGCGLISFVYDLGVWRIATFRRRVAQAAVASLLTLSVASIALMLVSKSRATSIELVPGHLTVDNGRIYFAVVAGGLHAADEMRVVASAFTVLTVVASVVAFGNGKFRQ